jgi:hypothetical protein
MTAIRLIVELPNGNESTVKLSRPRTVGELWDILKSRFAKIGTPIVTLAHGADTARVSFL